MKIVMGADQVCVPRTSRRPVEDALQIARPGVVHVQSHLGLGRTLVPAASQGDVPDARPRAGLPQGGLAMAS
jgi:phosphatidylinositol alpha 1,6-mannosyltransferase